MTYDTGDSGDSGGIIALSRNGSISHCCVYRKLGLLLI